MSSYTGPAVILGPDGTEHEVEVTVSVRQPTDGLGSWSGRVTSDLNTSGLMGETLTLRVPDHGEGDIIIDRSTTGTRGSGCVFTGSGNPPL